MNAGGIQLLGSKKSIISSARRFLEKNSTWKEPEPEELLMNIDRSSIERMISDFGYVYGFPDPPVIRCESKGDSYLELSWDLDKSKLIVQVELERCFRIRASDISGGWGDWSRRFSFCTEDPSSLTWDLLNKHQEVRVNGQIVTTVTSCAHKTVFSLEEYSTGR
eukprot:TRINITY_DN9437_c0_g1_i1.p1 TRINITY_DN9437_c0_g1~~TRINITY_DN9437_c0_g1_i1.p1  ORF type:complete len:164 (+),score=24.14 TRINITY_DN9437_c0_g1_i1:828-1319(+)